MKNQLVSLMRSIQFITIKKMDARTLKSNIKELFSKDNNSKKETDDIQICKKTFLSTDEAKDWIERHMKTGLINAAKVLKRKPSTLEIDYTNDIKKLEIERSEIAQKINFDIPFRAVDRVKNSNATQCECNECGHLIQIADIKLDYCPDCHSHKFLLNKDDKEEMMNHIILLKEIDKQIDWLDTQIKIEVEKNSDDDNFIWLVGRN